MIPSFLAPGLLLGSLAVGVPIALHFLYKPRYRKQPWAAMTFLRVSLEQTSRRVKFREWILLALRCLVLLLLAFALARPVGSSVLGGRGEGVDAVLVFDTSYSMGAADGDKTRFERAKLAAKAVIDNLPGNSTAQVITVSDRADAVGPRSPGNMDEAARVVDGLTLTALSGDVLPGLQEAARALERTTGPNNEVYLFGDLQKSGYAPQAAAIRAEAQELKTKATLLLVRAADPARAVVNVAVDSLAAPDGVPHTGSRLPVTVLVKNTGAGVARNLTVTLAVDGDDAEKESATVEELPPGQAVPVTLTAKLRTAGNRVLTARVLADDLPGDNRLDRVIAVRDAVRVLVIDGRPDPADPKRSASHFIANALVPVPPDRARDYHVQLTIVNAGDASAGLLGSHDMCVLCDVPAGPGGLTQPFVTRLAGFVRDGGALLVGPGANVQAAAYNELLGSGGTKLLPFDYDGVLEASSESPKHFGPDSADAAGFLARFRDEPYHTATADAEITSGVGLKETPDPATRVALRFAGSTPAIASRRVGAGEVVQLAVPLDSTGGSWPAKAGSFLTFAQLLLGHFAERPADGSNRRAGTPLTWRDPPPAAGYEFIAPSGTRAALGPATGGVGEVRAVTSPDATQSGVYRMTPAGIDPPVGPEFAVTHDPRDGEDLAALSDAELGELLGFKPVLLATSGSGAADYTTERSRREWTVWALLAVLAVAVVEAGWAWRCGRAV